MVDTVRENAAGYLYGASVLPIGRIYSTIADVPQHHVSCYHRGHTGCTKWISSKRCPNRDRLKLWLLAADEPSCVDEKAHMSRWAAIIKPL